MSDVWLQFAYRIENTNAQVPIHSSLGYALWSSMGRNARQELCHIASDNVVHLTRGVQVVHPHLTGGGHSVLLGKPIGIRVVHHARERCPRREEEHSRLLVLRGEGLRLLAKLFVP